MRTSTKVIIFLILIVAYVALTELRGVSLRLLTSRVHGPGIDYFAIGAFIACFCDGPSGGPMEPYPWRSACVLIGGLMMAAVLFLTFVVIRH